MRGRFLRKGFVIVACGAAWGVAAPLGSTSLPGQSNTAGASPTFEATGATHETRMESQTGPELPVATEMPLAQAQVEISPSTRSTFMASWHTVSDAGGYLLDVSTDRSFTSYVDGYHDLDVGNVAAHVVTGLSRGTTYYYRVRSYNADGPGTY
jgi:hypothetical protein